MNNISKRHLLPYFRLIFLVFSLGFSQEESGHKNKHNVQHRFQDAEKWAGIFEDPERDAWQHPDELIRSLKIPADAVIADIGSATGYFPVRFARVANLGQVYGIDIEPTLVDYLNHRAKKENLPNLVSILGEPGNPRIPEKTDLVFLCNTYHHIHDRGVYFEKLKRVLKPGGHLVIVDFKKGDLPMGPPDEQKLAPGVVLRELKDVGYRQVPHALKLPYQYVLVFELVQDSKE